MPATTTQTSRFDYPEDWAVRLTESRRALVRGVFDAMRTDYGGGFLRQFADAKAKHNWRCRLAEMTERFSDGAVADGADAACRASPDFPPTLRQIECEVRRVSADRAKAAQSAEAVARASERPHPPGMAKVAALVGQMRDRLNTPDGVAALNTPERWLETCLVHECLTWERCADKTMPLTRSAALGLWRHLGEDPSAPPGVLAALAAQRLGGQALSMFRQIANYTGRSGWPRYA